MKKMIQENDENSENYQAENMTFYGITADEARNIALDVFKANALDLMDTAKGIAELRAQEIVDIFIKKLLDEYPEGIMQMKEPDFQYSLFNVQKQYSRTGDKKLGDLLTRLLVDRAKSDVRSIKQIVLNESIEVVSKLTKENIEALSLILLVRYTSYSGIKYEEDFYNYLDNHYRRIAKYNLNEDTCYRHLEYAGCGKINLAGYSLIESIRRNYAGVFSKGFTVEERTNKGLESAELDYLFIPCLNDRNKLQISSLNIEILRKEVKNKSICDDISARLNNLYDKSTMKTEEIKNLIISKRDYMKNIFSIWDNSKINTFDLTTVGMTIAHCNIDANTNDFADLSIWVK